LSDGTTVIVPQICGNLSMNRPRHIAAVRPKHKALVALRTQPKKVRAVAYIAPKPVEVAVVPVTPVTFDVPPTVAPVGAPIAAAVGAAHGGLLPFLGLLFPIVASHGGGSGATSAPISSTPDVPLCSEGSNLQGVCQH